MKRGAFVLGGLLLVFAIRVQSSGLPFSQAIKIEDYDDYYAQAFTFPIYVQEGSSWRSEDRMIRVAISPRERMVWEDWEGKYENKNYFFKVMISITLSDSKGIVSKDFKSYLNCEFAIHDPKTWKGRLFWDHAGEDRADLAGKTFDSASPLTVTDRYFDVTLHLIDFKKSDYSCDTRTLSDSKGIVSKDFNCVSDADCLVLIDTLTLRLTIDYSSTQKRIHTASQHEESANAFFQAGDYAKAKDEYKLAASIYSQVGAEPKSIMIRKQIDVCDWMSEGLRLLQEASDTEDYKEAIEKYKEARSYFEKARTELEGIGAAQSSECQILIDKCNDEINNLEGIGRLRNRLIYLILAIFAVIGASRILRYLGKKKAPRMEMRSAEADVFCSNCGKKISEADVFCSNCGKKISEDITVKKVQNPAIFIDIIKNILRFLLSRKKGEIRRFDDLFYSNKWNEAVEYCNYLKSRGRLPKEIFYKIKLIEQNSKFPLLVFVDVESDPKIDEIWEIAALKERGNVKLGQFHSFIRSSSKIPWERLSQQELISYSKAPGADRVIDSFKSFLGNQLLTLVGHNIKFDIEKLSNHFKEIVDYPQLDTLELSYFCWPLRYSHTLPELLEETEKHRADEDVRLDIILLRKIIDKVKSFKNLERFFFLTLLDSQSAQFFELFLGKIPQFELPQLKEFAQELLSEQTSTSLQTIVNFRTQITFSDKIDAFVEDKSNIFISFDGYLPREEYYKNILNLKTDSQIIALMPKNYLLSERMSISELTGEKEPSICVSISSDYLQKFCLYRFWEAFPSNLNFLDQNYKKILLYLFLWSIRTKDGILDSNFMYFFLKEYPSASSLLQKSTYQRELCSSECPLRNQLCPTIYPRTNPRVIFTDFTYLPKSRDNHLIINEAHNIDEYLTEGLTVTISQKNIDALKYELSDKVELTSFEDACQQMKRRIVEFVEKRDLIQQKRLSKKLRIVGSFKRSNDWKELHEAKESLIKEIYKVSGEVCNNKDTAYFHFLTNFCNVLSEILPRDYEETEYVTWISIQYDDKNNVENWKIERMLIDITHALEEITKENHVIFISDSADIKNFLDFLNLKDKTQLLRLPGVKAENKVTVAEHFPKPTRYNLLSFLSNFGELVYELIERESIIEIAASSNMHTKILSNLLRGMKVKVIGKSPSNSRRQILAYTKRLFRENKSFVFIDTIRYMRRKNINPRLLLIERVPFPSFFDPIVSARSSRFVKSAEDYERLIIPRIALTLNEIITYAQAVSEDTIITDPRFASGYYAHTVTSLLLKELHVSERHSVNLERLHELSGRLEKILEQEGLKPKIDFSMLDPTSYLKAFFGFDEFREKQREIVEYILTRKETFAMLPTGHGKSLCYQIPAIAFSILMEGLTVIISPLQALMRDQVKNLHENGIVWATYINSGVSALERNERLKGIQNGWYNIVYVSPEQLRNPKTQDAFKSREICFFVIDEAHCLSQWGHDFRPDYMYISQFIESLPKRPQIAAFTATATRKVIRDTSETLRITGEPFTSGIIRENLNLSVAKIQAKNYQQADNVKKKLLLQYLASKGRGKNGIIYCTYTKTTEDLCYFLRKNSEMIARVPDEIEYFHGQMDDQRKIRVQDGFMDNRENASKISLIAATNAFGMGIDKEDIHFVIHYDIPGSIESYYQEIGRAGRKESLEADCLLLYWQGDLDKQRRLARIITEKDLIAVHDRLKQYAGPDDSHVYVSESDLANDTGVDITSVRVAVYQLERNGYLERDVNAWKTMTLRLSSDSQLLTADQEMLISSLDLNESRWKTIQIDDQAHKMGWTIEKVEYELRSLLACNPPILLEKNEVQAVIISDNPEKDVNSLYDFEEELLRHLIQRLPNFEAGQWGRLYSKEWRNLSHDVSNKLGTKQLNILEIIQQWQKQNLMVIREELFRTSLKLNDEPEKIFEFLNEKRETDILLLKELLLLSENKTHCASFTIHDLSRKLGINRSELRHSLLRLNDFGIVSIKRLQNTGNCLNLHLLSPKGTFVKPQDIVLKPKDLNLDELRKLQLNREIKIKTVQQYAESTKSTSERWQFQESYFDREKGDQESSMHMYEGIVKGLNREQIEVVTSPAGYLLVNSGAGTGKTETVARRILYVTQMLGIPSSNILALTFSKSGVTQLKERIKKVMPDHKLDVRTYHSLAYQILSQHAGEPPLWIGPGFRVEAIDKLIYNFKPLIDGFDDGLKSRDKLKLYQYAIEKLQSGREPILPEDIKDTDELIIENNRISGVFLRKIYGSYLGHLKAHNVVDFGFMLSQVMQLFKSRPEVLRYYQKRIAFIIVDEYQDTTPVQDELLRLLADWYGNLTAVGDNDQNIFAWNFADIHNILDFDKNYPGTRIINLERNYRSTKRILDVSNASIQHNKIRIPKTLYSHRDEIGASVKVHYTDSSDDIGVSYIISEIRKIQEQNTYKLREIAVLTKSGEQQAKILRALKESGISASSPEEEIKILRTAAVDQILDVMERVIEEITDITAYECYVEALHILEKGDIVAKFTDFVREFEDSSEDNSALAFIQYARSVSGHDFRSEDNDAINVLTIHKSKGLEFKVVFVTHLRRSSFPIWKGDLEEERRVFYVSLTRAMDVLHLISFKEKSTFIKEIEEVLSHNDVVVD